MIQRSRVGDEDTRFVSRRTSQRMADTATNVGCSEDWVSDIEERVCTGERWLH